MVRNLPAYCEVSVGQFVLLIIIYFIQSMQQQEVTVRKARVTLRVKMLMWDGGRFIAKRTVWEI